jgi:hypothetical protein
MATREALRPMSAAPATPVRPTAAPRPIMTPGREELPSPAEPLESHWAEAIDSATD